MSMRDFLSPSRRRAGDGGFDYFSPDFELLPDERSAGAEKRAEFAILAHGAAEPCLYRGDYRHFRRRLEGHARVLLLRHEA